MKRILVIVVKWHNHANGLLLNIKFSWWPSKCIPYILKNSWLEPSWGFFWAPLALSQVFLFQSTLWSLFQVDYKEKAAAGGQFPRNYQRRDLGITEREILISRRIGMILDKCIYLTGPSFGQMENNRKIFAELFWKTNRFNWRWYTCM